MAKGDPQVDVAALQAENEALKTENAAFKAKEQAQVEIDQAVAERVALSGGLLPRAIAEQVVKAQREWDADPDNPKNKK